MDGEPFCEIGGMAVRWCAHCRTRGRVMGPRHPVYQHPLSAEEVQRWVAARYGGAIDTELRVRYLTDPEYHARVHLWEQLHKMAFGAEHDWAELHERAAVHGFGPWIISEFYGTCRGCAERWQPGEMIRFSEDENGWVCDSCGSADPGVT